MSDRRVWLLGDAVNGAFEEPAVVARPGRRDGAELAAARVPVAAGDAETGVSRAG
jgi:molybdenum-dependent DNA-binding transcriptional regulator ModE